MTSAADLYFDAALAGAVSAGEATLPNEANAAAAGAAAGGALVVAYQGEPGAYSEAAVRQLFSQSGVSVAPLPCASFAAVFDAVASGAAPYCLVPIENSLGGSIHDNYDLLLRHKVTCVAELQFRVTHCLLALPGVKLEDIKSCYSHPQALAQCEEYLSKLGIAATKQYDTAGSAKMIAEQGLRNVAAIASELAAKTYGLQVLARRIEDDEGNFTRFLLLAPATTRNQQALYFQAPPAADEEETAAAGSDGLRPRSLSSVSHPNVANLRFNPSLTRTTFKTSLVFTLPDAPGTLFKALSVFALRDMHLCKIESRPSKHVNYLQEEQRRTFAGAAANQSQSQNQSGPQEVVGGSDGGDASKKFEYLFFIDTLSSLSQSESLKNGIRHLKEYAPFLRVLGSYPVFQASAAGAGAASSVTASHARTSSSSSGFASGTHAALRPLRIGIEGFGSFGQFLAKTFVRQGHAVFVHSRSDYSSLSAQLGVTWVPTTQGFATLGLDVLVLSMSILSFAESVAAFPWELLKNCLVVDVLSVKEHPRSILLEALTKRGDKSLDIMCTHPMFGPDSGKHSWKGLAFMYDRVRVAVDERADAFLRCFSSEGCRMLQMTCELHDSYAAGSQFLTHTTGRILSALNPISTPINTTGYSKLLQVVEQTQRDSWELYQGLYKYNARSQEQLEKFATVFDQLRNKLRQGMDKEEEEASLSTAPSVAAGSAATGGVSFNPRVVEMNESKTVAIAGLTKRMVAAGTPVISLSVGEVLSVKTPQPVIDATVAALQNGRTTYTAVAGLPALREAICAKLHRENGLRYTPDQIVVSNGAKQSIYQAVAALLTPAENEVVIPAPYWVSYPDIVTLVGGKPVIVQTTAAQGYILSAAQLEAAITPRTKLLILCSPSNPTGAVYTRQQLQALVEVLEKHPRVQVISDEIYEHLLFDGAVHTSIAALSPGMFARTVTINGFSKGYVMTGFRVGFVAAGNAAVAEMCAKVQGQITSCASSLSQHAALAALTALPDSFRTGLVATLSQTRTLLLEALRSIPRLPFLEPRGAFYVLLDCSAYFGTKGTDGRTISDSDSLCMYLLEVYHVALVPGSAFGAPSCLRVSYASSDSIVVAGAAAIKRALAELTPL